MQTADPSSSRVATGFRMTRVVACCAGAKSVASWSKQDGHISRTLIFYTDNGKRVVVRLPTPAAGPAGRNVNSEVATIKYLEHGSGIPLHHIWQNLGKVQKIKCLKSVAQQLAKSSELCFPAYDSLYLSDTDSLPFSRKVHLSHNFCIGPQCEPIEQDLSEKLACVPNGGSWLNMTEFANGLIRLGLSNVANKNDFWTSNRCWQGTPKEHANLLNHARRVLRILAKDPRVVSISTPTMLPCLTLDHTFVKPGEPETITCMTGWRACPISPAFLFSLNHTVSVPNRYLTSEKTEAHVGLLAYFDDVLRANISFHRRYIPRLRSFPAELPRFRSRPTHTHPPDYGQLHELFWFCHRTWADGIPLVQPGLLRIADSWRPLGLPGPCPFEPPTGKDLQIHELRSQLFADWETRRKEVNFNVGVDEMDHELVQTNDWDDVLERLKEISMSRCREAYEM
ncbi:hypothetical protein KCU95_g3330, partial [Aureobasidium melanogenum]